MRRDSVFPLLATLVACAGGSGPPPPPPSQFRVLPTVLNGPGLNVAVDGRTQITNWPFGQVSKAIPLAPGDHAVVVQAVGASSQYDLILTTTSGVNYTGFVVDSAAFAEPIVVDDAAGVPAPAMGALRVASYAALAPAVDVRRSQPDSTGLVVAAPFAFRAVSSYFQSTPGTWTVVVSHHGVMDTLLATTPIAVGAGQVRTVVLLDSVSGHLTWRLVPDRN